MKNKTFRKVDVIILSDIHLGTYGCHARELLQYMKSIKPKTVVLNGDIIDIWQFSKNYWPKTHMQVVKHLMKWITKGVKIYYITGNHDELLRKFEGFKMGSFQIVNKLILPLNEQEKIWIFHGDVFDVCMQYSKWLAKLGAIGYNFLILLNKLVNFLSDNIFKKGKISFSKKIKRSVKKAVSYINDFEQTAAEIGIKNGYQYVACGHIHQPHIRTITNSEGKITYLNSGDWIENLSALEFHEGSWSLYHHSIEATPPNDAEEEEEVSVKVLFNSLLSEMKIIHTA